MKLTKKDSDIEYAKILTYKSLIKPPKNIHKKYTKIFGRMINYSKFALQF